MATYRTPGVYVEEISTFPPSVAEVSTAIPAFIGYTEQGSGIACINTLLEYETLFGKAAPSEFTVTTRENPDTKLEELEAIQRVPPTSEFLMYYSLSLGCRTFLSCISKGFGGFCSRLLRLRTGKLSSAFRLHSFADIFGHPCGDILDSNRGQRLGNEVLGEFTAHAGNQEN